MTTTNSDTDLRAVYGSKNVDRMRSFVESLNEKQRRLFYGLQAGLLGHGGRKMLVNEFSTSFSVIHQGDLELSNPDMLPERGRTRRPGGGCKLTEEKHPEIFEVLERIMTGHIAGDPMNETVRWTDKRLSQIRSSLAEEGFKLSSDTIKRLLKKNSRSRNRSRRKQ